MTTPQPNSADIASRPDKATSKPADPALRPAAPKHTKSKNIQVSPAVLDAARKDAEDVLRELRTTPSGLAQTEAEERMSASGPNEVAQEKPQGWFIRLLKIVRNPLVILLAALSTVSFATGDARA